MKKIIISLLFALLLVGCQNKEVDITNTENVENNEIISNEQLTPTVIPKSDDIVTNTPSTIDDKIDTEYLKENEIDFAFGNDSLDRDYSIYKEFTYNEDKSIMTVYGEVILFDGESYLVATSMGPAYLFVKESYEIDKSYLDGDYIIFDASSSILETYPCKLSDVCNVRRANITEVLKEPEKHERVFPEDYTGFPEPEMEGEQYVYWGWIEEVVRQKDNLYRYLIYTSEGPFFIYDETQMIPYKVGDCVEFYTNGIEYYTHPSQIFTVYESYKMEEDFD